jgi:hypothetical protein
MPVMRGVVREHFESIPHPQSNPGSASIFGYDSLGSAPPLIYEGNGQSCGAPGTRACYNHDGFDFGGGLGNPRYLPFVAGAYLQETQWSPFVDPGGYHSLAELLISHGQYPNGYPIDTIEMGWTVDTSGLNGGDHTNPHLFVFFTNAGYTDGCYNVGCGFQQYPNPYVYAGEQLPAAGAAGTFDIFHYGGYWYAFYDGQLFGYFGDGLFRGQLVPPNVNTIQAYGEVATPAGSPNGDCTQMGNGINPLSAAAAAITGYGALDQNDSPVTTANPGIFGGGSYNLHATSSSSAYYGGRGPC